MKTSSEEKCAFDALQLRIKTLLPEEYQECYESVQPVSMGSAGLKYGRDGKVAWNDIWGTFCDLAMAGGPPHKGRLLEAASLSDIEAQPERYKEVVDEICRGVRMVTDLAAMPSPVPGWVRVECGDSVTSGWLARAIVMENVSAHFEDTLLYLPAGPEFRIEKEVKNVITAVAKTGHYFIDHMWASQQRTIANLFAAMEREFPLVQPAVRNRGFDPASDGVLRLRLADALRGIAGLVPVEGNCAGWLGLACPDVKAAIWMMRAMTASNIFARREDTVLFVPVNPSADPEGHTVVRTTRRIHGFATSHGII